jgi:glutamyl-tRNA synthetase
VILEYALKMVSDGNAYMDDSTSNEMFTQRAEGLPSPHREDSVADNLARFDLMLNTKEEGRPWCMRAKLDYLNKNKCLRDPVMFRHVEEPHNRTGSTYMAYPTYDFACPIVDAIEGVSHAMRTTEYKDRDDQYAWIGRLLGVRQVHVVEFARMNFQFTALSKRKLAELADNGFVEGWADPRFPTVRAVMRRGVTLEALREFILSQGASKRITDMEWDKFWATNKKVIDKVCPRYTAVSAETKTLLTLSGEGVPAEGIPEFRTAALHPKNAAVGTKSVPFARELWLEADDAALLAEGEEVTLMKWCNAVITGITKEGGVITGVSGVLKPEGDVRTTEKKLTWVSAVPGLVPIVMREFDVLITKARLEEGDDIKAVFNQNSIADTRGIAEPAMANAAVGDILQLERRGYYRVDSVPSASGEGDLVLFNIPSGKEKSMSTLSSKITRTDHATLDDRRNAATAERIAKSKKGGK